MRSKNLKNILKNKDLPTVSIIIVTRNVERTLPEVLRRINAQDYPKTKIEILVVDGDSTDSTLSIIKNSSLPIRVIASEYPNDPEAGRGEGLKHATGEIIGFIDADNYLPHPRWLRKIARPFISHSEIVGSYAMRFGYRKKSSALNRYFALLGSGDPVGYYLGKGDKLSFLSEKWNLYGKMVGDYKNYFLVKFDKERFPTLGSNGFFARKSLLLQGKADPLHYLHIDVPYDLLKMGFDTYAIVRDEIIHDSATSLISFLKKRAAYMRLHYQKRAADRRYKVFDPQKREDIVNLLKFIFFSLTFIQPLTLSIRGYLKKRDLAWFIHPIFCFSILVTYSTALSLQFLQKMLKKVYH